MSPSQVSHTSYDMEQRFRQLARNISRDGIGACISGVLAIKLPWLLASGVYNVANFFKNIALLHRLKRALREAGIRVKKRIIAKGILEGVVTKLASSILTLGHDELITASGQVAGWLKHAGSWISDHVTSLPSSWTFDPSALQTLDDNYRMNHPLIVGTTAVASWPAGEAQKATHVDGAAGWNASGGDVAKQVMVVGAVQLGAEKTADYYLEHQYDRAKDSEFYMRKRDRVKRWFRSW